MLGNNNQGGIPYQNSQTNGMNNPWPANAQPQMPNPVPNWNRPAIMQQANAPMMPQMGLNQPAYLAGRVISNVNDIRPNEVAMDGSVSLFPLNDYSCIYAKAWGQNGMIQTMKFVPEPPPIEVAAKDGPSELSQVMDRLDRIEKLIGQRKTNYNKHNQNIQQNKEVVSNE